MKHLKLFENKQLNIVTLILNDIWDNHGFSSYTIPFFTNDDAINWMINHANKQQEIVLNNEHITQNIKDEVKQLKLFDRESCENFYYTMTNFEGDEEIETWIAIENGVINSVEIDKDVKLKMNANKYNI